MLWYGAMVPSYCNWYRYQYHTTTGPARRLLLVADHHRVALLDSGCLPPKSVPTKKNDTDRRYCSLLQPTGYIQSKMSTRSSEPALLFTFALGGAAIAAGAMRYGARSTQAAFFKRLEEEALKLERTMHSNTNSLESSVEKIRGSFQSQLASLSTANGETHQRLKGIESSMEETNRTLFGPLSRGKFGELELELLINDCMPRAARFQYTLSNGSRADCVLNLPPPIGKLALDAKFPLEAFRPFLESDGNVSNVDKTNVKKAMKMHIDAISSKYIIPGETADYALMFLPSEAVFHIIARDFHDVLFQANKQRVYLASPTTLMALLAQLRLVSNNIALHEMEEDVLKFVDAISSDADRLAERFKAANAQLDNSKSSLEKMSISVRKIQQTCQKIAEAKQLVVAEEGQNEQEG